MVVACYLEQDTWSDKECFMKKKWFALPILAFVFTLASGCIIVDGDDSSLTIANDSSFILLELFITEVDNLSYGPDLLGNDVLRPGEAITVSLDCDFYDVLVVDEDEIECELLSLDLCFEDALWSVDNRQLNACAFQL